MIKTNVERKSIQLHRLNFKMYEYKARLLAGAVVVLQALLLIMPVSAFAATGEAQEIGVPQAMEVQPKGCFGVVLSPDGDGFYSVRDGLLTHYQVTPFKKIGSIAIDQEQLKDIPEKESCRVLITDDHSKLILVFREWIVLLDSRTGKISKKLEREGELRRKGSESSTLNGDDLVFLGKFPGPGEVVEGGQVFRLTVVDARSLEFKRQISELDKRFGFLYSNDSAPFITKIQDRLYLSSGRSLVVLNSKTYAPESALSSRFSIAVRISKDYRKLYVSGARFVTDHFSHIDKDYGEAVENTTAVFDQKTRHISFEKIDFDKLRETKRLHDQFDPILFSPNQSRSKDYVTGSLRKYALIRSRNTGTASFFYQYESGEAILIETRPKGPLRYENFQLTPGAKQYLMMKDSTGKVVPINDATFEKYHTNSAN